MKTYLFVLFLAGALAAPHATSQTNAAMSSPSRATALVDLTPQNSVFLYVDFNTGLDNLLTSVPGPQFMNNVRAFAKMGEEFQMPMALFGEENDFYGPFYPEIKALQSKGAAHFPRTTPTGYTPEFAEWLKETGRKNVIIGGISIDNCVMHTSLDLIRNGYNVFFMPDLSPTNNPISHESAVARLTAAGAVPQSWVSIATDLVGDWNSEVGKKLMPVMQAHLRGSTVGTPQDQTPDGKGL